MEIEEKARIAAKEWGAKDPSLISRRENAVYKITLANGRHAALRLHRPGYHTLAAIKSELWWAERLADELFPTPRPVRLPNGEHVLSLGEDEHVSVIEWLGGEPIGFGGKPMSQSYTELIHIYHATGGLLRQLHDLSQTLDFPEWFERPRWDVDGLTGESPRWGRYWGHECLGGHEKMILEARDLARERLLKHEKEGEQVILIHCDAIRENLLLANKTSLHLIDFDDSGWGFRMHDLACAISQSIDDPDLHHWQKISILSGYHGPSLSKLDAQHGIMFDTFALLRVFSSVGWAIERIEEDGSRISKYVERAQRLARRYLKGDPLAPPDP